MDYNFETVFLFPLVIYFLRFKGGRPKHSVCLDKRFLSFFCLSWHFTLHLQLLSLSYKLCEFLRDTFSSLITLTKVSNIFDIPCKELRSR